MKEHHDLRSLCSGKLLLQQKKTQKLNSHAKSPSFFDFFLFFATITRSNVIKVFVCSMASIEISDGTAKISGMICHILNILQEISA